MDYHHLRLRGGRSTQPSIASENLWGLPEGAQESPTHLVAIAETSLTGNDIDKMTALLHWCSGSLNPS